MLGLLTPLCQQAQLNEQGKWQQQQQQHTVLWEHRAALLVLDMYSYVLIYLLCCDAVLQVVIDPVYMVGTNKQVRVNLIMEIRQVAVHC